MTKENDVRYCKILNTLKSDTRADPMSFLKKNLWALTYVDSLGGTLWYRSLTYSDSFKLLNFLLNTADPFAILNNAKIDKIRGDLAPFVVTLVNLLKIKFFSQEELSCLLPIIAPTLANPKFSEAIIIGKNESNLSSMTSAQFLQSTAKQAGMTSLVDNTDTDHRFWGLSQLFKLSGTSLTAASDSDASSDSGSAASGAGCACAPAAAATPIARLVVPRARCIPPATPTSSKPRSGAGTPNPGEMRTPKDKCHGTACRYRRPAGGGPDDDALSADHVGVRSV